MGTKFPVVVSSGWLCRVGKISITRFRWLYRNISLSDIWGMWLQYAVDLLRSYVPNLLHYGRRKLVWQIRRSSLETTKRSQQLWQRIECERCTSHAEVQSTNPAYHRLDLLIESLMLENHRKSTRGYSDSEWEELMKIYRKLWPSLPC